MKITISHNLPAIAQALHENAKQVPFATALALTKTARDVKNAQAREMSKVFDRPTPYTLNSVFVSPATKAKLEAEVWLKGEGSRDYSTRRHFLVPQIFGGDRALKRFEERMVRTGYMSANERAVPGAGAILDSYGNVSKGQIVKILSQLQAITVSGDYSGATDSRRSRAKRSIEAYFVSRGKGSRAGRVTQQLPRGVWVRRRFGPLGTSVKPVFLFVSRAIYKERYKFFEVANTVIDKNFAENWKQSWDYALRTAR